MLSGPLRSRNERFYAERYINKKSERIGTKKGLLISEVRAQKLRGQICPKMLFPPTKIGLLIFN